MKVILKQDVANLGDAGDIVDVADGYGSNYLMPRGLAMRASKGAIKDAEAISRARRQRAAATLAEAKERAEQFDGAVVTLSAKADEEGHLYGSVGVTAIVKGASEQLGVKLEKAQLRLERPLKTVGEHEVPVHIHADVDATLRVVVAAAE